MQILHLISSAGLFGAERVVIVLSKNLKKRGFHPIIGVIKNKSNPHTEIVEEAKANGIETKIFSCAGLFDPSLIFKIRRFLRQQKIVLVHSHGYKSNLFALLGSYPNVPTITTNHNWLVNHWRLRIYCWLDSIWMNCFERIVAVSNKVKADMVNKGISSNKISVIDNGIDFDRFRTTYNTYQIKNEFSIPTDCIVVGTIGNLLPEKGHKYLIQAIKKVIANHEKVKLMIIGDGILREQLENMVSENKLNHYIVFTGFRKDIPRLLSMMDIFVLSSVEEGLPMVLLEAVASRIPVIATRVGAVPKVITDDKTGKLVSPTDVDALFYGINDLIGNPDKAKTLADNAYKKIVREFSSQNMCDRYIELYKEIGNLP